jgi:hypothetical protein
MFINEVHFFAERNKKVRVKPVPCLSIFLEVSSQNGLMLDRKQKLDKGFYQVTVTPAEDEYQDLSSDNKIIVQAIGAGEYKERKTKVAAMLSFEEPASSKWK